jgi:hypothetical protein
MDWVTMEKLMRKHYKKVAATDDDPSYPMVRFSGFCKCRGGIACLTQDCQRVLETG